jgi:hypothetical protein
MHKYYSLFFSVLLFLTACNKGGTPSGIIKEEQMTSLLTEVHIIDGSMYSVMQVPDSLYKYGAGKYQATFKRFHTDSAQFKKSFQYYASNPDLLQTIYEQVAANLKQKSDSLNKINQQIIEKTNKRVADSLKKLSKQPPAQPVNNKPGKKPVISTQNPI